MSVVELAVPSDVMLKPEPACLAIADITGYTRFLVSAAAQGAAAAALPAEPNLPVSRGRMVSEPLTAE